MKPLIFLDLDGVLADFVRPALQLFGKPELLETWPPGQYSLEAVLNVTTAELWKRIDAAGHDFWESLPAYPWAVGLYAACRDLAETVILTAPSRDPGSHSGKAAWLRRHLGPSHGSYIMTREKFLLTAPGRILVDDCDGNVANFTDDTATLGVVFPRPWNHRHDVENPYLTTVNDLRRLLGRKPLP